MVKRGGGQDDGERRRDEVESEQATVADLRPGMRGRWEVRTRRARHLWDLEAMTYTRLPGDGSMPMAYDGTAMRITHVERWPAVGGQAVVFFDEPTDPTLEHWRACSRIRAIVAVGSPGDPDAPDPVI